MNNLFDERLKKLLPEERILRQEPLSRHTTFRIGGPADYFVKVSTVEEVAAVIALCREEQIPCFVLGRGSNLLVSDAGYRGVILHIGQGFDQVSIRDNTVTAEAGIMLSALAAKILEQNLTGFEFAAGIPGTLGGAIFMNAGAYGGEMKQIVQSVKALQPDGQIVELSGEDCRFGYRDSLFQHADLIVLETTLLLQPGTHDAIAATMQGLMERRLTKQPLEFPSAGSVFKRPEGYFAGTLIEEAGLKGYRIGGAEVSEKHAGFIINREDATAEDVVNLIRHVQQVVWEKSGVHLEPEQKILQNEQLMRL